MDCIYNLKYRISCHAIYRDVVVLDACLIVIYANSWELRGEMGVYVGG